ncbi:MAG: TRAP transporter substrate-binding protein DctP [Alphaproteobacteria bacterium]|uniref:TRAP transporter substrate-binding protein n=1 Tax=Rhizobium/Agrobacterium group TaxID=227290 RepID=UPI0006B8E053|nr:MULTISPECIES: TRAP transporter substrate-binding protein DctP [Rhizobium/Agrobacterium group]MBU0738292.1 TRAP transporter substrate-binding protein DctP [Alphaproteobacteria bacterium]MDM7980970.1 TRAP transporter substrate-binding protein DctP [Rhizobium sp.]KPF61189.1 C4-dicarboxylate ABC transporter substrate-binding protein [Rhizobium sp. AAP116]MBU0833652.1 TRAP transporter substrate-binding protein DctP [Alphaproteobacteria bacterium]MBU1764248.1 TRAP transporter substrate-binding pr
MLKSMLKTLLLASALTITGVAQAADITLRATANSNENDEDYDGLVVFKNYVENASNGAIAVELFIGTQLCATGEECLQGVADGSLDIYISTSGGAAGLFPYIQVLDLPYLMSDDRVAETVLTGDFTRKLREKALADSDNKIRLMTIGNTGGWRNYANTQKAVKTPEDLKGLKMRTVPADLPQQVATAVGAAPTPIPWPELFTSLQTGVVEGTANGITDIMSMKFPDAGLKYLTLDGHSYMGAFWWMSNDRFQGLTPDQKQIVVDGFAALQQATFASPKRKEIAAYQDFAKAGGEIYVPTPAEKEAFKTAVSPVFDWFKTNVTGGAEVFDLFTAAVADAQKKVDAERAADLN